MELRVFKNVSVKLFILTLLKLLSLYIRARQSVYKLVAVASDSVKRESVELNHNRSQSRGRTSCWTHGNYMALNNQLRRKKDEVGWRKE